MEGLPDSIIPIVFSFLRTRDTCRCACVAKEWQSCAQQRMIDIKENAARGRTQVHEYGLLIFLLFGMYQATGLQLHNFPRMYKDKCEHICNMVLMLYWKWHVEISWLHLDFLDRIHIWNKQKGWWLSWRNVVCDRCGMKRRTDVMRLV